MCIRDRSSTAIIRTERHSSNGKSRAVTNSTSRTAARGTAAIRSHSGTTKVSAWTTRGGQANGTKVRVWDCVSNDPWQQWMITADMSTGSAYLKNVGSGKCLDDSGSTSAGVSPQIWDCQAGNVNQKWRMTVGYWAPGPTGSATSTPGTPTCCWQATDRRTLP